jgi:CRISPR/Cas system CSM-associated protein Csm2 small subunit
VKHGYDLLLNNSNKPILPNQNGLFMIKDNIFLDNEMDETLKELSFEAGYDIKAELLIKNIYLKLPESRQKKDIDISQAITQYVNENRTSKNESIRRFFNKLLLWICEREDKAKDIFPDLYRNKHYLYNDEVIAENIKQSETLNHIMERYGISGLDKLEEIIKVNHVHLVEVENERTEVTRDVLLRYGIDSDIALENAFSNTDFANRFIRNSSHDPDLYEYVNKILNRSKENIISYLKKRSEYDLSEIQPMAKTIFVIKKYGKEIYLLARPSDGEEIHIYYNTEKDVLDYSMDWELWVEDGNHDPMKITFGNMIKLSGLNVIPLKGLEWK